MKVKKILATLMLTITVIGGGAFGTITPAFAATNYYVSTSGSDSNSGTSSSSPFKTLAKAVSSASSGSTIYVASGTYNVTSTIKLSKSNSSGSPIKIVAQSGEPVIDFSGQSYSDSNRGFQISGSYYTIQDLKIVGAGDNGIYITGDHNTVKSCDITKCRDTGLQISNGGSNTYVYDVNSTYNYDPKTSGENADGFAAKLSIGTGNVFEKCNADYNSDDGFDLYDAGNIVKFYNCEASHNGVDEGNGNGFKVGGNYSADNHYLENCTSTANKLRGFDQNNNTGALTLINCTGNGNYSNFYFKTAPKSGKHVFTGCISKNGKDKDYITGATVTNCSFNQ